MSATEVLEIRRLWLYRSIGSVKRLSHLPEPEPDKNAAVVPTIRQSASLSQADCVRNALRWPVSGRMRRVHAPELRGMCTPAIELAKYAGALQVVLAHFVA